MIAKGLDFPNATLVGIINADQGLYLPDFRAGERIFQLLYQVCGRSGRGKKAGKAIIQTFNMNDAYITSATMMNTEKYYNVSLADRLELNYPPFSKIVRILFKGLDSKKNIHKIVLVNDQPQNDIDNIVSSFSSVNRPIFLRII